MKRTGRVMAICTVLFFHITLTSYIYFKNGIIEITDILATPVMLLFAYWGGKNYDKAKYLSEKDDLTGLYNRRMITKVFEKISSLADRNGGTLFLMVVDCDNFKIINDERGHDFGDRVLVRIGEVLERTMRRSDLVARWGGDEFLILGHYKEKNGDQRIRERMEEELNQLSRELDCEIMVSIGTALYPESGRHLDELMQKADRAMYGQKKGKKT